MQGPGRPDIVNASNKSLEEEAGGRVKPCCVCIWTHTVWLGSMPP
ncbi:unnamed protein product [Staurois parvus]|uniref:Uncharacterized protein n=1 Tax=Staurois parvus TaxID=386267 RepID=A0ABN9DTV1_9NEOB|nr:unnamed protein product [Staurois parvus]